MLGDRIIEIGIGVGSGVADVRMYEDDEASSATGRAVSAFYCVFAEVWSGGVCCEFGLLYAGHQNVVLGEEVINLLARVLYTICIELEEVTLGLIGWATWRGSGRRRSWWR